jgi:hypothetical protein
MKCVYAKQKQQVSFRFAEIASSRVGHNSSLSKARSGVPNAFRLPILGSFRDLFGAPRQQRPPEGGLAGWFDKECGVRVALQ